MNLLLFEEYIKINLKSPKKKSIKQQYKSKKSFNGNLILESRNINEMLAHVHLTYSHDH